MALQEGDNRAYGPWNLGECCVKSNQLSAKPYPSEGMICWPVSPRVGNVRNNDSSLIEPVAAA
jgi:putative SOS response-associated peptidase YedK